MAWLGLPLSGLSLSALPLSALPLSALPFSFVPGWTHSSPWHWHRTRRQVRAANAFGYVGVAHLCASPHSVSACAYACNRCRAYAHTKRVDLWYELFHILLDISTIDVIKHTVVRSTYSPQNTYVEATVPQTLYTDLVERT